jgi:hypothetical protein
MYTSSYNNITITPITFLDVNEAVNFNSEKFDELIGLNNNNINEDVTNEKYEKNKEYEKEENNNKDIIENNNEEKKEEEKKKKKRRKKRRK